MRTKVGRILLVVFGVVSALILLGGIFIPPQVKKRAQRAYPQIEGEMAMPGLIKPVEIIRDDWGIPHIYAQNSHDLFFAQGVVHAQDRFWQMDMWRHQGAGRLSELLGGSTLETDKFLRTLGWERVAMTELSNLDEEERSVLESYAEGVNAYLAQRSGIELGLEYTFLPLLNRGYQPDPWTPLNSLTWAKAMAWDLRGNLGTEIDRALLLKSMDREEVNTLYPPYPDNHPVITAPGATRNGPSHPAASKYKEDQGASHIPWETIIPILEHTKNTLTRLDHLRGIGSEGIGSNSWAISGEHTDTGKPYLANDPHLGQQIPSIWYEVGLHCQPKGSDCPIDIVGFSFAGVPGIIIGHNDRIAWGFTNVGSDVMDLYIEKINPENPDQYRFQGKWVDMEILTEEIRVAGGATIELEVRKTRHGPIIGEVYGLEEFSEQAGIEVPEDYALALQWTALEPSCVFCAIWDFNQAESWEEFRKAASEFAVPAQNLIYADVDGNIGYQMPGTIPIRNPGHDGMLPIPGWTGEYEWQGTIPFDDLPYAFNPPEGYLITANNAVVGEDYPYLITKQWSYGYRAQRIEEMIQSAPRPITQEVIQTFQGDNKDLLAEKLVPLIMDLPIDNLSLMEARALLATWDYQADMDSAPTALYMVFWQTLLDTVLSDDLPETYNAGVDSCAKEIIRRLISQPRHPWWDDKDTRKVETRDEILLRTLHQTVKKLKRKQGPDPNGWSWGGLHTITFTHDVMSSLPVIKTAFNRGPYPTAGGNAIVNANGWSEENPFHVDSLPSMRMIVDLRDLTQSLTINTTGQSGHPYHPHYIDMVEDWRTIQYHPMLWGKSSVEAQAEGTLRLIPGD
ncbi:MAG: penicillin acylase family protein [Anaerolineales bacterium]